MTGSDALRYIRGDQVRAGELNLERMPLKADCANSTLGRVAGALIDIAKRRVAYLLIETWHGERLIPFHDMCIDWDEPSVRLIGQPQQWERFDRASVHPYDDEALIELLFRSPAA